MGRTVFELAAAGVPTLAFSQNEKEEGHVHIGGVTGSLWGGRGHELSSSEMADVIGKFLMDDAGTFSRAREMSDYRTKRSNSAVVRNILESLGLDQFS